VAGAWCLPAAPDASAGTCRKVQGGGTCQGAWQCPYPYACLIPDGATMGTCGPGHKLGEACTLRSAPNQNGPSHDCAAGISCLPDAAGKYTCSAGRDLGQSCTAIDLGGGNSLPVSCRQGSCRLAANGTATCLLDAKLGEPCSPDLACEVGLVCDAGKCRASAVALGATCTFDGSYTCPEGARCASNPADTSRGTCVAWKKTGAPCADPDECEPGATCTGGTCVACK
jgi:hypothetical protein